ncbi:MAG: hypothetical protein QXN55_01650 [Candidatus Nitrosotenuis sp.]
MLSNSFFFLAEGTAHLEDLPIDDFLSVMTRIGVLNATEKMDGVNLWFGFDDDGKFYTSRKGKNSHAERRYSTNDYPEVGSSNVFKVAHSVLSKKQKFIGKLIKPGQAVEIEVALGDQPNSIAYNAGNRIILIGGVGDNPVSSEVLDKIAEVLNKPISITVDLLKTSDGKSLTNLPTTLNVKIERVKKIDKSELQIGAAKKLTAALKDFLDKPSEVDSSKTNHEIATLNLTSIDKEERDKYKEARDKLQKQLHDSYMLPIKQKLLGKVTKHDDTNVEGVVLSDPETGEQIKLVDKDVFTAINDFTHKIRKEIAGVIATDDPLASEELKGGIFGEAKLRIARLLGNSALARGGEARKILERYKGANPTETATNFADAIEGLEFEDARIKINAILDNTQKQIDKKLDEFKKNSSNYKLKLKSGKEIRYSPETIERTLLSFAELNKDISKLRSQIKKADSFAKIIMILYSNQLKAIHTAKTIKESLLVEYANPSIKTLDSLTTKQVCTAYTASLLASQLVLRYGDRRGISIVKDTKHATLTKVEAGASPLNFWGTVLFSSDKHKVKILLDPKTARELEKIAGRFVNRRINFIHKSLSTGRTNQDWSEHLKSVQLVALRLDTRSKLINTIATGIANWDDIDLSDKAEVVSRLIIYVMQSCPNSPLLEPLNRISQSVLTMAKTADNTDKQELSKMVENLIKWVMEDGEVATTDAAPPTAGVTSSTAIATVPMRLFRGKIIKRIKRDYVRKPKFPRQKTQADTE